MRVTKKVLLPEWWTRLKCYLDSCYKERQFATNVNHFANLVFRTGSYMSVDFPKVMLLIESSRSSGRELLHGIVNYVRLQGPWSFYWEPRGMGQPAPAGDWRPDGIILRDSERLDEILAYQVPTVVVGHSKEQVPGMVNIITDSDRISRIAAEHLLACGLTHFAFCGFGNRPWSRARLGAFADQLRKEGYEMLSYESDERPPGLNGWQQESAMLAAWLISLPKPVGIMGCNDDRAQQVIEACKLAGLQVPEEVAVIGADNDELVCDLADPPLSSVAINFERAGYEAATVLARLMRGEQLEQPRIDVHPTHVVERRSTNMTAVEDAQVARALQYIRSHSREPMQVDDVVRAAGVSRRVLEKRFRRVLRRSVLEEIRRARIAEITRLLVDTDASVLYIAVNTGFTGIEHIARYFRASVGMSPSEYRRSYGRV